MTEEFEKKENKESFKVVDKRRFNTEGRENTTSPEGEKKTVDANSNEQQLNNSSQTRAIEKIDFISFIVSLGTQALVMLGEMPNPETRLQSVNIEGARQTIDILAMMEEKTKGNLNPQEEKLLAEILSTLRMTFVKKVGIK